MKKFLLIFISISLLLTSVFPAFAEEPGSEETFFYIVHTNDIHGYYKATGRGQLGFEKLKSVADAYDAQLLLDAGDTFHGQAFATIEQGKSIAQLMDFVGYDAVVPGNHDFSYGAEQIKEWGREHDFKILACNIEADDGSAYFEEPYLIKEITADNGSTLKVGVLGVTDDAFAASKAPENIEGLKFLEETRQASETAESLRAAGCDIVIALSHLADCKAFAKNTRGIDIVIAGHEHQLINESCSNLDGEPVYVTQSGHYFQAIGVLKVSYDFQTGKAKAVTGTQLTAENIEETFDEQTAEQISLIEERQADVLDTQIGSSSREYPYSWGEIRTKEQEIGRIVTGAYLNATGADVAIENAGGLRAGIPQGSITYHDIISISPYGNYIVTLKLTGEQILNIIEHSLEIGMQCSKVYALQIAAVEAGEDPYQYSWPDNSGSYLQFGGIRLQYDPSRPEGSRVVSVFIGKEALDTKKIYTVATNNYVVADDDYPCLSEAEILCEYGTCEQALIRFIKAEDFEKAAAAEGISVYTPSEKTPEPTPSATPNSTSDKETAPTPEKVASPDTGDHTTLLWSPLLLSGLFLLLTLVKGTKRQK